METALSKLSQLTPPLPLSLHPHRPSISRPISSLSFKFPKSPDPNLYFSSTTVKSSSNPQNPKSPMSKTLTLKTTFVAGIAAAALFLARLNAKPLIAAPISSPTTTTTTTLELSISDEDKERNLEEYLASHSDDVQTLRDLVELKIKGKKVEEAMQIIDRLIELEPEVSEWPLLKSHMYCYIGDTESAKKGFNEILNKDPLGVEAYHGLVVVASQGDSVDDLLAVEKRIKEGVEVVRKQNRKDDVRDFMLLLAQVRLIGGEYDDALKIYDDLVKEEPRDFRPYLCQGIIYTLLSKKDEAEKNFQKYRRLVPEGHPYVQYFDDDLNATKLFSQKMENERARVRS